MSLYDMLDEIAESGGSKPKQQRVGGKIYGATVGILL